MRLIDADALIMHLNDWALSVSGNDTEYEDVQAFIKCVAEWPSAQTEQCGDMISKEYLKEHIEACWINGRPRHAPELNELLSWIDDVPSAQPEDYTEMKREFLRMASYIDVLLECSDEQKETLMNFISRLAQYIPWTERD